jgi:hypothetical protein
MGSRPGAQRRTRAGQEHTGHRQGVSTERGVAGGVHAAVDPAQLPVSDAAAYRSMADPKLHELTPRHQAVLSLREVRDRPGRRPTPQFCTYSAHFCGVRGHGDHFAGRRVT